MLCQRQVCGKSGSVLLLTREVFLANLATNTRQAGIIRGVIGLESRVYNSVHLSVVLEDQLIHSVPDFYATVVSSSLNAPHVHRDLPPGRSKKPFAMMMMVFLEWSTKGECDPDTRGGDPTFMHGTAQKCTDHR